MNSKKRAVITKYNNKYLLTYIVNDRAVEFSAFDDCDFNELSDVYVGEVVEVKSNISSCFVQYRNKKKGFLKRADLKPGTMLPVSVKKHSTDDKQDVLTDSISLPGIYAVVHSKKGAISVSSKINNKSKLLDEIECCDTDYALTIRTNAKNVAPEIVKNEIKLLAEKMDYIVKQGNNRTKGSILYKAPDEIIQTVMSFDFSELDEIITDDLHIYEKFCSFKNEYIEKSISIPVEITFYEDKIISLEALLSIKTKLDEALSKKVWLKSGGYLYIEKTEALTVVDVNTGTTTIKGDKEKVIKETNLDAANEIARQMRLRNLSGIIVVDFLKEKNDENIKELTNLMSELLKRDNHHARCYGMTRLGLMEISRERKRGTLSEQLRK